MSRFLVIVDTLKQNRIISSSFSLMIAFACIAASAETQADEGGASFWLPGQFGSFSATLTKPGLSLSLAYHYASTSTAPGKNFEIGGRIETGVNARTNLLFITPTYTFSDSVLGGQAAISITGIFGHMDASADATLAGPNGNVLSRNDRSSLTGIGDLFPFGTIRWNEGNHNFMTYTMLGVPVGNYQVGHLTNLGINHWSVDIGGGYTYFNTQNGREFSVVAGFTRNFENHGTQYRNGDNLHLDWGISQLLAKHWHIGLVGYFYHQVTGDSGSGALLGDFKSRVGGIGPQAGYQFTIGKREVHLNIRGYKEFDAQNRPEGWNAWLTLTIPIGSKLLAASQN
ncbi:transporter [Nitrosomonas sp.]|uniref:SphA family protein n=1 Tax=Nitrosomonas sp. TaxID=42353 RepID=UPI0027333310|nr:transporter [Nitrosomonas sp.]